MKWIRKQYTYRVGKMRKLIKEALTSPEKGLKVIIAEAECQIAKQRREKPLAAKALKAGDRVIRTRFGVDEDTCTGDHSCIRLSGCPSLSVKPNPDPLRKDPVATVLNSCVGCGLCGEVADAAVLCPSFFKADVVQNPSLADRALHRVRSAVIGFFRATRPNPPPPNEFPSRTSDLDGGRRPRRRGRRRAHDLDRSRSGTVRISGPIDFDSRRRPAYRSHDLLRRDLSPLLTMRWKSAGR